MKLYLCTAGLVYVQFNGLVTGVAGLNGKAEVTRYETCQYAVDVIQDQDAVQLVTLFDLAKARLCNPPATAETPGLATGARAASRLGQRQGTTDQQSEAPCVTWFARAKIMRPLNNNLDYNDYQEPVHSKAVPVNQLEDISNIHQQILPAALKHWHTSDMKYCSLSLLSLTMLLSGVAATHAPTDQVNQLPTLVCPTSSARKCSDRGSVSTMTSAASPDLSSAQSTPALTHFGELDIAENLEEGIEWYNSFDGVYTFNLKELVAEVRANLDNLPVGETVNGWKRVTTSMMWKLDSNNYPMCTIHYNSQSIRIGMSLHQVPVACFDFHSSNSAGNQKEVVGLVKAPENYLDHLKCYESIISHYTGSPEELNGLTRCFNLAKDYNPQTSHTTPTTLKLPEMETTPALLKELLQVLKSCGPAASDSVTRLPSAATPEKESADRSTVSR